MNKRLTRKERRRVILTSIFCFFIIGLSVISSVSNISKIEEKKLEKKELTQKLENLKEEEKTLTDDVEERKNPE